MKQRLRKKLIADLFPKTSLNQESIQALMQAKIGDGGYLATGDVCRENNCNKTFDFSYEEQADFLKKCGISPERFFVKQ